MNAHFVSLQSFTSHPAYVNASHIAKIEAAGDELIIYMTGGEQIRISKLKLGKTFGESLVHADARQFLETLKSTSDQIRFT
ncbi:hypothetical protein ACOTTU_06570 [Roseobacter sp. EG26]|uniref:hypothetical protein n=1 Tax=Roseobacter sp. EG26 TaxID=3412477 RepID=UPI003CE52DF1